MTANQPATKSTRPLNCALVGLGMVASAHLPALQALSGPISLRGIYSRSPEKHARMLNRFNFSPAPLAYEAIKAIAADKDIDFVIIITPPNARVDMVRKLAEAGKHILLEKPIERDAAAASEIVHICKSNGVTLGVVFQNRTRQGAIILKNLLEQGVLGTIGTVEIDISWWRDQAYYDEPGRGTFARDGGGVLISQAIHTLDLALDFAGPVKSLAAMVKTSPLHQLEAEDFAAVSIEFTSGAAGFIHASTTSFPGAPERIKLNGTLASAELRAGELTIYWRDGRVEQLSSEPGTGGGADPMAFPFLFHQNIIADFASALEEHRAPLVTGEQALEVHRLIDAIARSSKTGKRIELA